MAINIPGFTLVATKMASGNVQFLLQNPNGGVRYCFSITGANCTSINTTVNGGATGTALTFVFGQDANASEYPTEYVGS